MPKMAGERAMLEQLIADGVRHVFGNPGTTEQGFMDVLQDYPQVEFMPALHEGVAVCMADAYARLTRQPAFVEVHIAPSICPTVVPFWSTPRPCPPNPRSCHGRARQGRGAAETHRRPRPGQSGPRK